MKTTLLTCLCSVALALSLLGQDPTASPVDAITANPMPAAAPSIAPTVSPAATPKPEDLESVIEKKIREHFNVSFDHDGSKNNARDNSDDAWLAIPIVFIVFVVIFGLPVAIVGVILYFSFSRTRALHRTVRLMVEKGQEVPAALLNPPPVARQRSDLRRGVVLLMVGLGLMIFFAAVNDWEGGAWSLGIIPFLIGMGYLLVWRLDVRKSPEEPPPLAEK